MTSRYQQYVGLPCLPKEGRTGGMRQAYANSSLSLSDFIDIIVAECTSHVYAPSQGTS